MGQGHSAGSKTNSFNDSRAQCYLTEEALKNRAETKEINYLINKHPQPTILKHPPVKRPKIEDVKRSCTVCKQRKIIEELPKQKVKMTVDAGELKNRWDEMGNDSRSKMPWKATCY